MRARMSAAPPAANVQMMRTGRDGQSSARAGANADASTRIINARNADCRFTGASFCSNSSPARLRPARPCGQTLRPRRLGADDTDGRMAEHRLPKIAIATGDPAGIGPEVSLKAALDAGVGALCRPILV